MDPRVAGVGLLTFTKATSVLGTGRHCQPQASPAQGAISPLSPPPPCGQELPHPHARCPHALSPLYLSILSLCLMSLCPITPMPHCPVPMPVVPRCHHPYSPLPCHHACCPHAPSPSCLTALPSTTFKIHPRDRILVPRCPHTPPALSTLPLCTGEGIRARSEQSGDRGGPAQGGFALQSTAGAGPAGRAALRLNKGWGRPHGTARAVTITGDGQGSGVAGGSRGRGRGQGRHGDTSPPHRGPRAPPSGGQIRPRPLVGGASALD